MTLADALFTVVLLGGRVSLGAILRNLLIFPIEAKTAINQIVELVSLFVSFLLDLYRHPIYAVCRLTSALDCSRQSFPSGHKVNPYFFIV